MRPAKYCDFALHAYDLVMRIIRIYDIFFLIYFCERFKSYIITNCECTINNRCVSKNTRQIIKKINLIIQPDRFCPCDVLNFFLVNLCLSLLFINFGDNSVPHTHVICDYLVKLILFYIHMVFQNLHLK